MNNSSTITISENIPNGSNANKRNSFFLYSLMMLENMKSTQKIIIITVFVIVFSIVKILYSWKKLYLHYIPEPITELGIGFIFGYVLKQCEVRFIAFSHFPYFVIFLPPIIFEAVLHLHKMYFFRNISSILIFGFIGTILTFLFIGLSLFLLDKTSIFTSEGLHFHPSALFLLSGLVTSIDSVIVISILGEIHVHPSLYVTFLGESVINDGLTLILFEYVYEISCHPDADEIAHPAILIPHGILVIIVKILGSCSLGAILGISTCILTKYTSKYTIIEPLLVLSVCYFNYLINFSIGWSGVFSLLIFGLLQTSYTFENISQKSQITIKRFAHMTAAISESLIFLSIGYTLAVEHSAWYTNFILVTLLLCTVSRFIIVYSLASIADWLDWLTSPIPPSMKFAIAFCGLRGAISHCMVEMVKPECLVPIGAPHAMLETTILFLTFFTVIAIGAMMRPLMYLFKMHSQKSLISLFKTLNEEVVRKAMSGVEEIVGLSEGNKLSSRLLRWEQKFLRRHLVRDHQPRDQIMDVFGKITVALHYASLASTSKKADQYLSKLHPIPKRLPVHIITQHWPSEFNILSRGPSDLHGFIELSALESVPSSVVGTASSIATVSLQEKCASGGSSVQPVPGTVKTAAESSDWRKTKKRLKMPDALIEESSPTSDDLYSLQNGNVSTPSTESSTSSSEAGQRGKVCSPGCINWVNALKTNYPNIKNVQEMDYALRRMFSRSMEHLNYVEKMRYAIRQKHSIIRYQQKLQHTHRGPSLYSRRSSNLFERTKARRASTIVHFPPTLADLPTPSRESRDRRSVPAITEEHQVPSEHSLDLSGQ